MKNNAVTKTAFRILRMLAGLFLFALGQVFSIQGAIGLAPWDVLNSGLSNLLGGTFGQMNVCVGLVLLVVDMLLGEKLGLGTVCNALLIGTFIDLIQSVHLIPKSGNFFIGVLMMCFGMFLLSVGTVLYIGAGFGSGPRDSLMVALRCRFSKVPVGVIRGCIEGTALIVGWIMGGTVGLGTVIAVFGISVILQLTFSLFRFDPAKVKQESLLDSAKSFRAWVAGARQG